MRGGEEVVPNNQVGRRLDDLYAASSTAKGMQSGFADIGAIVAALNKQTRALLADRLNYQITAEGQKEIARATRRRSNQIERYG
jgi:hypothetical protein